jgi:ribonuclease D
MLADLSTCAVIGVDAEMDSIHGHTAKLCLIQISSPDADYLLDPLVDLELSALGELFAAECPIKVLHAAENDIPFLKERIGCEFRGLFDSYLVARVLGRPKTGLSSLLEEYFGVIQDKRFQTADWRVRPLPHDQEDYARLDTRYLLPLRELLLEILADGEHTEEIESEFRRACRTKLTRKPFDPDGWARISGARWLSTRDRSAFRALYHWREERARATDQALFRILPDKLMLDLSQMKQFDPDKLRATYRHLSVQRHATEISQVLAEAERQPPARMPARVVPANAMTKDQQTLFEALKKWRNATSAAASIDSERVFSNRVLKAIAQADPPTYEDFVGLEEVENWQVKRYGPQAWAEVELVRNPPDATE